MRGTAAPSIMATAARRTSLATAFLATALIATVFVAACGGKAPPVPPPPAPTAPPRAEAPRSYAAFDTASARLTVYVATNRRYVQSDQPAGRYSGEDADSLQYASVLVNVPPYRNRGIGELPRRSSFSRAPNPEREFFVSGVLPTDSARFVQRLAADLALTKSRDVLVFVHGFNVSFEDAVLRAAQLAVDVGFDGAVVVLDWPSAGSVTQYVRDLQEARNGGFFLLRALTGVIPAAQPDRVHVLVHSMGAEVLARAAILAPSADSLPRLAQVALAAPDFDSRVFRRDILAPLRARSTRVTLYASSDDDALRASRALNGVWRLGLGGDSLTVLDGMDTIDASRVRADALGHTLFGNPGFLADLAILFGDGRPPAERRLLPAQRGALTFWRFRGDGR
ncbi:MAG: alpha/beta hydrolase [Gemmatimonadaceae bacterium]|nr:alpha/beta hydrolase [Gemmatimonadaceae bacterium]